MMRKTPSGLAMMSEVAKVNEVSVIPSAMGIQDWPGIVAVEDIEGEVREVAGIGVDGGP